MEGIGNTFLKTKNSNRLRRGRVPSVKKRWSPVLRQGQDRAPACRRAFGSHTKGKGSSGNAERAQRYNAASSLSGRKNHTHPAAKVLANPSSKSHRAHSLLNLQQHTQAPMTETWGWFLPTEQVANRNINPLKNNCIR